MYNHCNIGDPLNANHLQMPIDLGQCLVFVFTLFIVQFDASPFGNSAHVEVY